jgi:uncharacterized protein (DUF736 family)
MNIGQFKRENGVIVGSIVSPFGILQNVAFEAIQQKGNGPDFILTTDAGELGAAWKKTSAKGNGYLSVSIRSPFLPGYQVFCALVESTRDAGNFALVWSEPKQDEVQG